MELRVAPGTTADELRDQLAEAAPDAQVFLDPSEDAVAGAVSDRAIGLQAAAVLAVGIVVAVVSILFLVLGLSRVLGDQAREAGPLLAAGLSASTLRAVTLITAAAIAVVGSIGAIAISIALSPLSPVGLARRAEPDPGVHVDPRVMFVGVLATVVVALLIALGVAARHRHVLAPASPGSPSALPARLAAQTSDVAVATGLRFAGRRTGSRAATQLTVALACLAVVASLTFATSAAATVREPERYGWGWALSVGNPNDPVLYERLVEGLADHPAVGAATAVHSGCGGSLDHGDGHAEAPLIATEPLEGSIQPQVQSGRLPNGAGRGRPRCRHRSTARGRGGGRGPGRIGRLRRGPAAAHRHRHRRVQRRAPGRSDRRGRPGRRGGPGAARRDADPGGRARGPAGGNLGGRSPRGAARRLRARRRGADRPRRPRRPRPRAIAALSRRRFIAVLALGTLGFTLGSGLRRSRRDVAVLKAMGFTPAQARRSTFVHALALVAVPALIGTALGVAAGRIGWGVVADGLGAPNLPEVPLVPTLAAIPARPARGVGHRGSPGDARRSHRPVDHPASRVSTE